MSIARFSSLLINSSIAAIDNNSPIRKISANGFHEINNNNDYVPLDIIKINKDSPIWKAYCIPVQEFQEENIKIRFYNLNSNDFQIQQPNNLNILLKDHQKTSCYAMIQMENASVNGSSAYVNTGEFYPVKSLKNGRYSMPYNGKVGSNVYLNLDENDQTTFVHRNNILRSLAMNIIARLYYGNIIFNNLFPSPNDGYDTLRFISNSKYKYDNRKVPLKSYSDITNDIMLKAELFKKTDSKAELLSESKNSTISRDIKKKKGTKEKRKANNLKKLINNRFNESDLCVSNYTLKELVELFNEIYNNKQGAHCYVRSNVGALVDEPGSGKTLMLITLIISGNIPGYFDPVVTSSSNFVVQIDRDSLDINYSKIWGTSLVIIPNTVVNQWIKDFKNVSPDKKFIVIDSLDSLLGFCYSKIIKSSPLIPMRKPIHTIKHGIDTNTMDQIHLFESNEYMNSILSDLIEIDGVPLVELSIDKLMKCQKNVHSTETVYFPAPKEWIDEQVRNVCAIICVSDFFDKFMEIFGHIQFGRCIFDEADKLIFPNECNTNVNALFTWVVTASGIIEKIGNLNNQNYQNKNSEDDIDAELDRLETLNININDNENNSDELVFRNINQTTNIYNSNEQNNYQIEEKNHYQIEEQKQSIQSTIVDNNAIVFDQRIDLDIHIERNITYSNKGQFCSAAVNLLESTWGVLMTVKNNPVFAQSCMGLPPAKIFTIYTSVDESIDKIKNHLDRDTIAQINAGDIVGAAVRLGGNATKNTDFVKILQGNYERDLHNLNEDLRAANNRQYTSEIAKVNAINTIVSRITGVQKRLHDIINRASTNTKENVFASSKYCCPVCFVNINDIKQSKIAEINNNYNFNGNNVDTLVGIVLSCCYTIYCPTCAAVSLSLLMESNKNSSTCKCGAVLSQKTISFKKITIDDNIFDVERLFDNSLNNQNQISPYSQQYYSQILSQMQNVVFEDMDKMNSLIYIIRGMIKFKPSTKMVVFTNNVISLKNIHSCLSKAGISVSYLSASAAINDAILARYGVDSETTLKTKNTKKISYKVLMGMRRCVGSRRKLPEWDIMDYSRINVLVLDAHNFGMGLNLMMADIGIFFNRVEEREVQMKGRLMRIGRPVDVNGNIIPAVFIYLINKGLEQNIIDSERIVSTEDFVRKLF